MSPTKKQTREEMDQHDFTTTLDGYRYCRRCGVTPQQVGDHRGSCFCCVCTPGLQRKEVRE